MKTFKIGDEVTRNAQDTDKGVITGIMLRPGGKVFYVTWADHAERAHYSVELRNGNGESAKSIGFGEFKK